MGAFCALMHIIDVENVDVCMDARKNHMYFCCGRCECF
jgi:hypothetical protein